MDDIEQIKNHYEIALELINLNQLNKARHELYNKMNDRLYDLSLDLMDNRNISNSNKEIKNLICEVHNKLGGDINEYELNNIIQ